MLASCASPSVLAASLTKRLRISRPTMPPQQVQVFTSPCYRVCATPSIIHELTSHILSSVPLCVLAIVCVSHALHKQLSHMHTSSLFPAHQQLWALAQTDKSKLGELFGAGNVEAVVEEVKQEVEKLERAGALALRIQTCVTVH